MAENIRKPARTRMWKRIAIATASVSTAGLIALAVISFLPKGSGAFTIRVDNPQGVPELEENLNITFDKDGELEPEAQSYIVDNNPLDSVMPTTAELIENYLKSKTLVGNNNWSTQTLSADGTSTATRGLAQVFTIYLENKGDKELELKYTVNLDSFARNGDSDILDYFRILIQTEMVDEPNTLNNAYFGRVNNNPKTDGVLNELGNKREPISTRLGVWSQDQIKADFRTNDTTVVENGYCHSFAEISETNKTLVNDDVCVLKIGAGKKMRFTYVAYFEGEDMDCNGSVPSGSFLLLSLHFGV